MSLEVEYERPYQRNEPESLQNIISNGYFYNIRAIILFWWFGINFVYKYFNIFLSHL